MITNDAVSTAGRLPAEAKQPDHGSGVTPSEEYVRIEHVAARTGLTKRTLRYYEEIGLLAPPTRTEGGYRLYSQRDITELDRIKRLKELLGFSLAEIRDIALAEEQRDTVRAAWASEPDPRKRLEWLEKVEAQTRTMMRLIEEKQKGLAEMHTSLVARLAHQEDLRTRIIDEIQATDDR